MKTEDILKVLLAASLEKKMKKKDLLSTGSGMFNLVAADTAHGGLLKGHFYLFTGDSGSGKTFLTLTAFAEAAANKEFDDYELIHDDVENGALMDFVRYFGKKAAKRIRAPREEDGEPVYSETIEDFYFNLSDLQKSGKKFIYVLDSMDALSSQDEGKKFDEAKKAARDGKTTAGSYGDGKAKKNSQYLRKALQAVRDSNSILVVITQTRENIGFGAMFEPKVRAGGKALGFYAAMEIWTSKRGKIKKTVKGKERQVGVMVKLVTKKNRITGKDRTVNIPIFHSTGIDDIGSCVDFLTDEKHWKKSKKTVTASDFDFVGSRDGLIKMIEDEDMLDDLYDIVQECWDEIEEASKMIRKSKYK